MPIVKMSVGFSRCSACFATRASYSDFFRNLFSRADKAFKTLKLQFPEGTSEASPG